LLDVTLAQVQNAGTLSEECAKFAARGAAVAELAVHESWICAYTVGSPTPTVSLKPIDVDASAGMIAARARLQDNALGETEMDVVSQLQDEFEREHTPLGARCWHRPCHALFKRPLRTRPRILHAWRCNRIPRTPSVSSVHLGPVHVDQSRYREHRACHRCHAGLGAMERRWWVASAMRREDSKRANDYSRRAYTLAPLNANVAGLLADQLLEQGAREEVRSMAIAMGRTSTQFNKPKVSSCWSESMPAKHASAPPWPAPDVPWPFALTTRDGCSNNDSRSRGSRSRWPIFWVAPRRSQTSSQAPSWMSTLLLFPRLRQRRTAHPVRLPALIQRDLEAMLCQVSRTPESLHGDAARDRRIHHGGGVLRARRSARGGAKLEALSSRAGDVHQGAFGRHGNRVRTLWGSGAGRPAGVDRPGGRPI